MENGIDPRILECVDESRRDFVKKLLIGSAFAVPAIASFPMDALAQTGSINIGNMGGPLITGPRGTQADPKTDPKRDPSPPPAAPGPRR